MICWPSYCYKLLWSGIYALGLNWHTFNDSAHFLHRNLSERMRFLLTAFNVISLLAISVSADREEEFATARIFLHKSTVSQFPLIIGSDFIVKYVVSNNGEASATSLVVTDRYDPSSFELIENVHVNGSVLFSVEELAPGALVRN